jgi:hypothetical protein
LNWPASLKWQRLKRYDKFATMIDRQWHGHRRLLQPENNILLGFGEGLNSKSESSNARPTVRVMPTFELPNLNAAFALTIPPLFWGDIHPHGFTKTLNLGGPVACHVKYANCSSETLSDIDSSLATLSYFIADCRP